MDEVEFELLEQIDETHWWFRGKRALLRALVGRGPIGRRVLDLGCGTGGALQAWSNEASCFGVDLSPRALSICKRRGLSRLARADLCSVPFAPESFDTIFVLDVIEHLDDDAAFMERARELCVPGGRIIVAVPAFQLLWSKHDVTYHHKRRYTATQLDKVLRTAGFVPERVTYTNFFVFPVAAVWRILSYRLGLGRWAPETDFWPVPEWLNALLTAVYRFESLLIERWNLPFGVSVVCIARARGSSNDD